MKQLDLTIVNPTGLHARPAAVFVKTAKKFKSKITVRHGKKKANAKSVISVLALGVESGSQIQLLVEGEDEEEALTTLQAAVAAGLGDDLNHRPQPTGADGSEKQAAVAGKTVPSGQTKSNEKVVRAIPAAPGVAIGPLYRFKAAEINVETTATETADPVQHKTRLEEAIKQAKTELRELHRQMLQRLGAGEAAIFEAHLAILDDPELFEKACEQIEAGQPAGSAWSAVVEEMANTLASLNDELLAARAADVRDVGRRVLRILSGVQSHGPDLPEEPVILVAPDLSPSDTVSLDTNRVLGFCTASGGANGHTAILARALGIPAIVGAGQEVLSLSNGTTAVLNGDTGTLTLDPDADMLTVARNLQKEHQSRRTAELQAAHTKAMTADQHPIEVAANIGSVAEARQAVEFGAEAIGLLRTEFLFLNRTEAPSEEYQFEVYRDIALAMDNRPVIIRTLDIGGDKPLPYLNLPPEENPFLGQRGIRLCLARPELLRTQLRAILRAAKFGHLRIMFPMITSFEDWTAAKRLVDEVRAELDAPPVELGIMIEVPAAALLADVFAQEVDFFSIGTNDLTQYTLAIDRTHPLLSEQADGLHPAVLRLIKNTVQAAHSAGKWVGVCGELAADAHAVPVLVGLGVDELSVSIPAIPTVKAQLRSIALSTAQHLAEQTLACATPTEVRRTVDSLRSFSQPVVEK
ncbi:MAG: phosphoenolpyruvate--protein phosphotransferase [Chloroflexi bacterium]|nr:MAG: phosphoenolpyruvate--protein phosphotransferase [Chloroflexota bacterium]